MEGKKGEVALQAHYNMAPEFLPGCHLLEGFKRGAALLFAREQLAKYILG